MYHTTSTIPAAAGPRPPEAPDFATFSREISLPLGNLAYSIDAFLADRGVRLDAETRALLAQLRDRLSGMNEEARRLVHDTCPADVDEVRRAA